jgi:predicted nucleic acid-binding protein
MLLDALLAPGRAVWRRFLAGVALSGRELVGPELLWSEFYAALHAAAWRGDLPAAAARQALRDAAAVPISTRRPRDLRDRAWDIADRMGWARTYDAEYCALAEILGCELVTTDGRLRAAGQRLGYVFTPAEMAVRLA